MKRDYAFFDKWCRQHGMRPARRITDVTINGRHVGDILLADSGDTLSTILYPPMPGNDHGMPRFYRTGYAIDRPGDRTWLAAFNDYAEDSFSEYAGPSRAERRLGEALKYAAAALELTHSAGLYNGNDRRQNFN